MLLLLVVSLLVTCSRAEDKELIFPRLTDISEAETFIDSAEVVIVGFFEADGGLGYNEFLEAVKVVKSLPAALCNEKEVWAKYGIDSDTISVFRKADLHQENLQPAEMKNLDKDRVVRFLSISNIRYITEYNQVVRKNITSAVGLFQSKVKVHVVLFANRGSKNYSELKERVGALGPRYAGKMLFVLINGKDEANARALGYFNLKSGDLPRVGLYDAVSDKTWLMGPGEISTERVQTFCDSFLSGELQKEETGEPEVKSEL
ncbi:endoplasmic reticulum resident protein 27 isoform X2 [Silurus meridionalis]|uniref:endoplasmic reticulum resident protein 27 isoform X2 n=1 Tax=Silurus meridionalis TaxID=175797 RepID=UPI001EEA214D|nr:endoplasmic reticulum resident protein 27 isoform X2 [Silurus meridionalis]